MSIYKETMTVFLDGLAKTISNKSKFSTGEILNLIFEPNKSRQSLAIKVGINMPKLLKELISKSKYSLCENNTSPLTIGKKTRYITPDISVLYGSKEVHLLVRSSLNLDTKKVDVVEQEVNVLEDVNEGCVAIICMSYYSEDNAPTAIKNKWSNVKVVYADRFFKALGIEISEADYYQEWKSFGKKLN